METHEQTEARLAAELEASKLPPKEIQEIQAEGERTPPPMGSETPIPVIGEIPDYMRPAPKEWETVIGVAGFRYPTLQHNPAGSDGSLVAGAIIELAKAMHRLAIAMERIEGHADRQAKAIDHLAEIPHLVR